MSARLWSIIAAAGLEADSIEQALFEIRDNFYMTTAEGVQLDTIGSIFGVPREGLGDDDYRGQLVIRAASFFSGTPEDIISACANLLGGTSTQFVPMFPAGFTLFTDASITKASLEILAPAGVEVFLGDFIVDAVLDPITDAISDPLVSVS